MWRAFFLGLGVTCVIFGAGCTVVDKVVLAPIASLSAPVRAFRKVRPTDCGIKETAKRLSNRV